MKKGISLIVLVITIIVMIIIAGAIIISLNSSNIIAKANTAVVKTDVGTLNDRLTLAYVDLRADNPTIDTYETTASGTTKVTVNGTEYDNLVTYYTTVVTDLSKVGTGTLANYQVQYNANGSAEVVEKTTT